MGKPGYTILVVARYAGNPSELGVPAHPLHWRLIVAPNIVCPACTSSHLVKHCEDSRSCTWLRCTTLDCKAVFDVRRRCWLDRDGRRHMQAAS